MNGFFQLLMNGQGVNLCVYPPTDGGLNVEINEVVTYLQMNGILYDVTAVNLLIKSADKKAVIHLPEQEIKQVQEMLVLSLAYDMMSATARFYPPSNGGSVMDKWAIIEEINNQKVYFGIDEAAIDLFVSNRQYCTDIVVASGVKQHAGKDAYIEYYFNTDLRIRPTLKEDGGVDFFNLNTLNHCKAGDVLAKLFKEEPGEIGTNVLGNKLKPADVKKATLQFSNNIEISEDKTILTSKVNGHVCLIDGKVFVSDIYQVDNVDNSTGNIEYEGSILVNGTICSNFEVKAKGNVEVRGVVEGAFVEAGGDIIIARGMNGMNKGTLKAGGNIITKFIENATVEAGGYIETESILHSRVMAKTEVNVLSRRGFITGGIVCATNSVNVKNLGSPMGTDTVIEIGVNPATKKRYQDLQKEVMEIQKTLKTIEPILTATKQRLTNGEKLSPDRLKYVKTLAIANKQKQEELTKNTGELLALQAMMDSNTVAQVTVSGEVYSGTKIVISDAAMTVPDTVKFCRFIKQQGEVKMTAL